MGCILHIGIDDTDSLRMGCTTYIAAILVEKLCNLGLKFIDYPGLIRLNPNVPWKTRGNGALSLRVISDHRIREAIETVIETVEEHSDYEYAGTDPGIVFYQGNTIPQELEFFSKRAIQDVVKRQEAFDLIKCLKAEAVGFNSGRGIIGALAAIGEKLAGDHTYELIAYRIEKNRGTIRRVDPNSVFNMDNATRGLTYNNVDPEKRRVLITPRGPDPVLYGIRGETADVVRKAQKMIKVNEEVERWVIFKTNQGTDAHLSRVSQIDLIRPYQSVVAVGSVTKEPRVVPRRHVIFTIGDSGGQIDCAAYEPTGKFRNNVKKLIYGDLVEVYGGVKPASSKHPLTINLEKIRILNLVSQNSYENPVCSDCNKRMKSMGKGKGFRCEKCGYRNTKGKKTAIRIHRALSTGLYIPPPRAHRHLTKPMQRYGKEKNFSTNSTILVKDFWSLEY